MADTTKLENAPKWGWASIIIVGIAVIIIGVAVWAFYDKKETATPRISAQTEQIQKNKTAEKKEMLAIKFWKENPEANKFLLFSLIGVIFLAIAIIPKLPANKFLGGIGALSLAFGLFMWAFAINWPSDIPRKSAQQTGEATAHQLASSPFSGQVLPTEAKFVRIMKPGDQIFVIRTNMDAPVPEFYGKFENRYVQRFDRWPLGDRSLGVKNTKGESYEFYIFLPPGQDFKISDFDPALPQKQASQAPNKPPTMGKAAQIIKAPPNELPTSTAGNKSLPGYAWNGKAED